MGNYEICKKCRRVVNVGDVNVDGDCVLCAPAPVIVPKVKKD